MSASAWILTRISLSRGCPRSIKGPLSSAQTSHSSRCRAAPTSRLSATVRRRQRQQHRTAALGRRLDAVATPTGTPPAVGPGCGSAARPPRRRSARDRRRATWCPAPTPHEPAASARSRSDSRVNASEMASASTSFEAAARPGASAGARSRTRCWLRRCRSRSVHRERDDVPRRHDRVRLEHRRRRSGSPSASTLHQSLLHQILSDGWIGHPGPDDPTDDRNH